MSKLTLQMLRSFLIDWFCFAWQWHFEKILLLIPCTNLGCEKRYESKKVQKIFFGDEQKLNTNSWASSLDTYSHCHQGIELSNYLHCDKFEQKKDFFWKQYPKLISDWDKLEEKETHPTLPPKTVLVSKKLMT